MASGVDPATSDRHGCGAGHRTRIRQGMIVAGWSAYPQVLDFAASRSIAGEVEVVLVDMAHFAGLVAAGLHRRRCRTDVVSTTVHKTLGGGRSA